MPGASIATAVKLDNAEGAQQPNAGSSTNDSLLPDDGSSTDQAQGSKLVLEGDPILVDRGDLKGYLGQPPFTNDRIYNATPAGVVMGLAWCIATLLWKYEKAAVTGDEQTMAFEEQRMLCRLGRCLVGLPASCVVQVGCQARNSPPHPCNLLCNLGRRRA